MRYGSKPEHTPQGNPCTQCGYKASQHRLQRTRVRRTLERRDYKSIYNRFYRQTHERIEQGSIGIDGEGVTLPNGDHIYVYLAASGAKRDIAAIANPRGLSSKQIFDFLLALPKHRLKVGYGLGYDKTLWVRDLPDASIYSLARPEIRLLPGGNAFRPVKWNGYALNLVHKRFTVTRGERRCTIWDFLGFFQRTFVRSLKDWEIGTQLELEQLQAMKDQRGDFKNLAPEQVQAYCRQECRMMAQLADKLIAAHDDAGLTLRSYYGAGSTASVLLDKYQARNQKAHYPPTMVRPIQHAFFGGRFEISRVGPTYGKVYQYDIASAYPHAMSLLPCFVHGQWAHAINPTQTDLSQSQAALVRWQSTIPKGIRPEYVMTQYGPERAIAQPWGPLPFRRHDGNIVYPAYGGRGWVWRNEFLAAQRFSENITATEAWLYFNTCACPRPFAAFSEEFQKRVAWGKSGKGQVLKLGLNSCYGKRAQRMGAATFRCMVSAGIITSDTRARLLDAMTSAEDRHSILSVATDGLLSTKPLPLPCIQGDQKELGAWEVAHATVGVFMIRPGFEFSLNLENESTVKARGAGKGVVLKQRQRIIDAWEVAPGQSFALTGRVLFRGMKTSITQSKAGFTRRDYAKWKDTPLEITYRPTPKRPYATKQHRLYTWVLDETEESAPYDGVMDAAESLRELREIEEEQPDSISEEL